MWPIPVSEGTTRWHVPLKRPRGRRPNFSPGTSGALHERPTTTAPAPPKEARSSRASNTKARNRQFDKTDRGQHPPRATATQHGGTSTAMAKDDQLPPAAKKGAADEQEVARGREGAQVDARG